MQNLRLENIITIMKRVPDLVNDAEQQTLGEYIADAGEQEALVDLVSRILHYPAVVEGAKSEAQARAILTNLYLQACDDLHDVETVTTIYRLGDGAPRWQALAAQIIYKVIAGVVLEASLSHVQAHAPDYFTTWTEKGNNAHLVLGYWEARQLMHDPDDFLTWVPAPQGEGVYPAIAITQDNREAVAAGVSRIVIESWLDGLEVTRDGVQAALDNIMAGVHARAEAGGLYNE